MHRTLAVPELLNIIFHASASTDILNLALVCKNWKHWALEAAWCKCGVPIPLLLGLLGPVERVAVTSDEVRALICYLR